MLKLFCIPWVHRARAWEEVAGDARDGREKLLGMVKAVREKPRVGVKIGLCRENLQTNRHELLWLLAPSRMGRGSWEQVWRTQDLSPDGQRSFIPTLHWALLGELPLN